MEFPQAVQVMEQFKSELEEMRNEAKPGDSMPAEVFFAFMDILVPAMESIIEEAIKLKGETNGTTD